MHLWAELEATQDTLRVTEEEVIECKREKIRFLETMTNIAVIITLSFLGTIEMSFRKHVFIYF